MAPGQILPAVLIAISWTLTIFAADYVASAPNPAPASSQMDGLRRMPRSTAEADGSGTMGK
jgi:hypothetical protein